MLCILSSSPECTFLAVCKKKDAASKCSCAWGLTKTAFPETQHAAVAESVKAMDEKDDDRSRLLVSKLGFSAFEFAARLQQVASVGERTCR